MDKFEPPSCLRFEGNLSENWQKWCQELELYLTATEKDAKSDKIKTSILLTCIGKQGREIYNTFQFKEGEKMKFNVVVQKFQDYCSPRKNITFMRHKFFTCKQRGGQSFDEFVTELKKRSADCEFDTLRDSLIRDIIICGINDNRLRERLLSEPELTLQIAVQLGHAAEETKRHVNELQKEIDGKNPVDTIKKKFKGNGKKNFPGYDKSLIKNCKFCNCSAYGKKCKNCLKPNHFAKCCPKKSVEQVDCDSSDSDQYYAADDTFFVGSVNVETATFTSTETQVKSSDKLHDTNSTEKAVSNDEFIISAIGSKSEVKSEWTVDMDTNGSNVRYKLDTGAQVN